MVGAQIQVEVSEVVVEVEVEIEARGQLAAEKRRLPAMAAQPYASTSELVEDSSECYFQYDFASSVFSSLAVQLPLVPLLAIPYRTPLRLECARPSLAAFVR